MQKSVSTQAPRILVAGIDDSTNQFTRAIESYGMEAVHFGPNNGNGKSYPTNCDALICVTSYSSHDLFWDVKDAYKAMRKKVFISRYGFSKIKDEFEQYFLSDFKKQLEEMTWTARFYYLLARFIRVGERFKLSEIEIKIGRFYSDYPETNFRNFINQAVKHGSLERCEGRGKYIFRGLTEPRVRKFKNNYGIEIPAAWRKPLPTKKAAAEEAALAPPKEEPKKIEEAPPTPEMIKAAQVVDRDDIRLVLDVVSEMERKMTLMYERMERLFQVFNPALFAAAPAPQPQPQAPAPKELPAQEIVGNA